jgi:hypothetical protein
MNIYMTSLCHLAWDLILNWMSEYSSSLSSILVALLLCFAKKTPSF